MPSKIMMSAGAAAAAVLTAAASTSAPLTTLSLGAETDRVSSVSQPIEADPPCTGTRLDQTLAPLLGAECGSGEGGGPGDDPSDGVPPPPPLGGEDEGGDPPPPGV